MAKIRIGLGSEFNLNNGNLGLGVTNPQVRLDVDGTVKSKDFEVIVLLHSLHMRVS